MKTRPLTPGAEIPYLGFGTYLIADDKAAAADGRQHVADLEARALGLCQQTMETVRQRMGLEP